MARRNQKITVMFTDEELLAITEHCKQLHTPISSWLRAVAFLEIATQERAFERDVLIKRI